ncbi:hypothetical protein BVG79_00042 [Ketogulonicigenium robustum]|uniref:Uncharacterized protein n=1 Tax=Ketogulonicigenium robustum TaxID=92947 RepID=A0A1W6NVY8_9RHOB|nr:hypothetical protein BVG79_00042 [Ketogulonicigenium robustum]
MMFFAKAGQFRVFLPSKIATTAPIDGFDAGGWLGTRFRV